MSATPLALALILLSSLCWSGLDLSRKLLVERIPPLPLLFLLTVVQIPLFAVWVWLEPGLAVAPGYWAPALGSTQFHCWMASLPCDLSVLRSMATLEAPFSGSFRFSTSSRLSCAASIPSSASGTTCRVA